MAVVIGVKRWVLITTAFLGLCTGGAVTIGTWRSSPALRKPCIDSARLETATTSVACTDARATLTTEIVGERRGLSYDPVVLFKCICRRDGGQ